MRPNKPGLLAGPALRKIRDEGLGELHCWFSADADVVMHGGELLTHSGVQLAASVRSTGYGHRAAGKSSRPASRPHWGPFSAVRAMFLGLFANVSDLI